MDVLLRCLPQGGVGMVVRNLTALLALATMIQIGLAPMARAQSTSTATAPTAAGSTGSVDFDLGSTSRSMPASASGTIIVGGAARQVSANDMLTAAEHLALFQVLNYGAQSLTVAGAGNAIAGRFNIDTMLAPMMSGLLLPQGVTAVQTAANLNLTGNLTNLGSYYALSQHASQTTANLAANNILNQQGALISTILPSSLAHYNGIAGLNLSLSAVNDIINAGTISSAGNLSLTAGSGIINNSNGILQSAGGDVNLAGGAANNLTVNNSRGLIEAALGSINVRDASFTGKYDATIRGGDLYSHALNIHSGDGTIDVNVKQLTGVVNVNGGIAHLVATTAQLDLGTINLSGDPTFYNRQGDIFIKSDLSFPGQHVAVIANGDIIADGARVLNTSSNNVGGSLTLIAGASFDSSNPDPDSMPSGPGDNSSVITIHGPNQMGGKIDLLTNPLAAISTVGGFNNGGNITMVAWYGTKAGSGTVVMPDIPLTTGSGGTDLNGYVTIIAGAPSGTAIRLGDVSANGANNGTGAIYVLNAQASLSGCANCNGSMQIVDGRILSGAFNTSPNNMPQGGGIIAGDLTSSGGAITLIAGNNITTGTISTIGKNGSGINGGIALRGLNVTTGDLHANSGAIVAVANNVLTVGNVTNTGANLQGINGGIQLVGGAATGNAVIAGSLTTSGNVQPSAGILVATSSPTNCVTCPIVNRPTDTQGDIVIGTVSATGIVDLRAGGNLSAGAVTSHAAGGLPGQVFILTNNEDPASGTTFTVGTSGSNAIPSISVGASSAESGSVGITSGGSGGINLSNQAAIEFQVPTQGSGPGLGVNARNGLLTTAGTWDVSAIVEGNGGRVNLAGKTISFTNTLSIVANGAGEGAGGNISITADDLVLPASQSTLVANGAGSFGGGGSVTVSSTNSTVLGAGGLSASAKGSGFAGSGNIVFGSANGTVDFNGAHVLLDASSTDGSGGAVSIASGGLLNIGSGSLTARVDSQNGWAGFASVATGSITTTSGSMSVNASSTAAGAGFVTFYGGDITTGTGGIAVNVDSGSDFGGSIDMSANSINMGSGGVTFTANGAMVGGFISAAINSTSGGSNVVIAANANGDLEGSGGFVSVSSATGNNIMLGSQAGRIMASATGYSTTGNPGTGGTVSVFSGKDIIVDGSGVNVTSTGTNGNGGTVNLQAGAGGPGTIQASGIITADGSGTGNGGTINLAYNDSNSITSSANISARSLGGGLGGTITVSNSMEAQPVALSNSGSWSVQSAGGNGSINFVSMGSTAPTQNIIVQGNGSYSGNVNANGVNINFGAASVDIGQFIATSANSVSAPSINLAATSKMQSGSATSITTASLINNGLITSGGAMTLTNAGSMAIAGTGEMSAPTISATSASGAVQIAHNKITGTLSGAAGTSFSVTTQNSDLVVGSISANNGNLSVVANGGHLTVNDGAALVASEGSVLLQNNFGTGNIVLRTAATVLATGQTLGNGQIYVVLGGIPATPVEGTTPANMLVTETNGGNVYFGANGITSENGGSATADGASLVFDTNGRSASGIVLVADNNLTASYTPPQPPPPPPPADTGPPFGNGNGQGPPEDKGPPPGKGPGNNNGNNGNGNGKGKKAMWAEDEQNAVATADDTNGFKPVAFIHGSVNAAGQRFLVGVGPSVETATATVKAGYDSDVLTNGKHSMIVRRGELMTAARDATIITAGDHRIALQPGAIVHISYTSGLLKVRNLSDSSSNAVTVIIGGSHKMNLHAGNEIVASNTVKPRDAMSDDRIARRMVREYGVGAHAVATAEFSFVSLLQKSPVLSEMCTRTAGNERPLVDKMMKTSVALTTVTASHGMYSRVSP
jgi:hypothetical protein